MIIILLFSSRVESKVRGFFVFLYSQLWILPLILFFIVLRLGNAKALYDEISCNIALLEYRGYGRSDGQPGEDGLYMDAQVSSLLITTMLDFVY